VRAAPIFGPCRLLARALLLGWAALLWTGGASPVHAQGANGDAAAKAKFTVMLSRFVQWPSGALAADGAPLRLCVFHNSPTVGAAFSRHAGEVAAGRVVSVVANPAASPGPCNVVFVDASAPRHAAEAVAYPAGTPVLVVGAVDGFAVRGGMVELVNVDDALRFDVNVAALRGANLGLSSQVLKLARQLRD
jgi:hypothetical protein